MRVTPEEIAEVVSSAEKQRFHFFNDKGELVRTVPPNRRHNLTTVRVGAGQGHNRRVADRIDFKKIMTVLEIGGPGWKDVLCHGTKGQFVDGILRGGLLPGGTDSGPRGRAHIHLVTGIMEVGDQAGLRSGSTHLVRVNAKKYVEAGGVLYRSNQGCMLTEGIDSFEGRRLEETSIPRECIIDVQDVETGQKVQPLPAVNTSSSSLKLAASFKVSEGVAKALAEKSFSVDGHAKNFDAAWKRGALPQLSDPAVVSTKGNAGAASSSSGQYKEI